MAAACLGGRAARLLAPLMVVNISLIVLFYNLLLLLHDSDDMTVSAAARCTTANVCVSLPFMVYESCKTVPQ